MNPKSTYEINNPLRQPDWRLQRAQRLCEAKHAVEGEDEGMRAACRLLEALEDGTATEVMPDEHAAWRLYSDNTEARWELEARILARQSIEDIAKVMDLSAAVVETYEQLFFNVLDRLDKRGPSSMRVS